MYTPCYLVQPGAGLLRVAAVQQQQRCPQQDPGSPPSLTRWTRARQHYTAPAVPGICSATQQAVNVMQAAAQGRHHSAPSPNAQPLSWATHKGAGELS